MAELLTRTGARNLTREMDRVASTIQKNATALGVPDDIALDYAKRSDLLSDTIELTAVTNFPKDAAEVDKTPAADADPEVPQPTAESAGPTDEDPKSDDQNKPETYYGKGANGEKLAAPVWAQPARNETGESVEPAGSAAPHWDANAIGDDRGGPYLNEPDESYMGGHFAQNWFHELRDKQEAGQIPGLDKFASRMAMTACLSDITHVARLGTLTDADVRQYINDLTDIDKDLATTRADIAKISGALQARADQLSKDQKKLLKEFGDKLPETLKAQGQQVVEVRDVLLSYTKVAAEKPPTETITRGGVLEMAEEKFGAEVRDALADIFDAVRKENVGLKKAVARIQYSKVSSDKEAGVMDWLAAVSDFFGKVFRALTRLFEMASSAIFGASKRVDKAFANYEKAHKAALKSAASDGDDVLLRRLLAEETMGGDDESDDDESEDKKAADESDESDEDAKTASDHGFNLFN